MSRRAMMVSPGAGGGGAANGFYRTITIDHTKVGSSDSSNFPVLVSGTYAYLKTVGHGGKGQSAGGFDIRPYSDNTFTTLYKFELVAYDPTTGTIEMWVKVPSVSHSSDTTFVLAYGKSADTSDVSDKNNTWDANYKSVQHFPDGSTVSIADSTSNAISWTNSAAMTAGIGLIDGGWDMGAVNTNYELAVLSGTGLTDLTLSFWVKLGSVSGGPYGLCSWAGASQDGTPSILIQRDITTLKFYVDGSYREFSFTTLTTGVWYHIGITFASNTTWKFYKDGAVLSTYTGAYNQNKGNVFLGTGFNGQAGGVYDEFRVSTGLARSADYFLAMDNNYRTPSTFYALGVETGR